MFTAINLSEDVLGRNKIERESTWLINDQLVQVKVKQDPYDFQSYAVLRILAEDKTWTPLFTANRDKAHSWTPWEVELELLQRFGPLAEMDIDMFAIQDELLDKGFLDEDGQVV